jgi:hypothetical protein
MARAPNKEYHGYISEGDEPNLYIIIIIINIQLSQMIHLTQN